jgi:antitoxin FitA
MAAITVRDLDDRVREQLRVRAARHGRSMEAEVRLILEDAVSTSESGGLFRELHERFAELGGVELELPARTTQPRAADLT